MVKVYEGVATRGCVMKRCVSKGRVTRRCDYHYPTLPNPTLLFHIVPVAASAGDQQAPMIRRKYSVNRSRNGACSESDSVGQSDTRTTGRAESSPINPPCCCCMVLEDDDAPVLLLVEVPWLRLEPEGCLTKKGSIGEASDDELPLPLLLLLPGPPPSKEVDDCVMVGIGGNG